MTNFKYNSLRLWFQSANRRVVIAVSGGFVTFIAASTLMLSVWLEFPGYWPLFAQAFPHIVIYPVVVSWAVTSLLIYASLAVIAAVDGAERKRQSATIAIVAAASMVLGGWSAFMDSKGERMMLFEFSAAAEIERPPPFWYSKADGSALHEVGKALLRSPSVSANKHEIEEMQKWLEHMTNYKKSWEEGSEFQSISRRLYLLVMSIVAAHVWYAFFFTAVVGLAARGVSNKEHGVVLWLLLAAVLGLVLWLPFRLYYIEVIHPLLWGDSRYNPGELMVYAALVVFSFIIALRLMHIGVSKAIVGAIMLVGTIAPIYAGIRLLDLMDSSFGLKSQPFSWLAWPFFLCVTAWIVYANRDLFGVGVDAGFKSQDGVAIQARDQGETRHQGKDSGTGAD
jgi:hypothetical protein